MAALSDQSPPFFPRGPSPTARLAFFGILSLCLLFVDSRYRYLEPMREIVAIAMYPLQRFASLPLEATYRISEYFQSVKELESEQDRLQRQLLVQAPLIQAYPNLVRENAALRQLAKIEGTDPSAAPILTEALYGPRDPFSQKLVINKGEQAQIRPGQAVIDQDGVLGQVTRVYPWMSEVTLITDKEQTTPVKVRRSGARSVLYGAGAGRPLELRFMAASTDVQPGDVLVTSGIDGTYPPNLNVAIVTDVERETGALFAHIQCQPSAGVDRSRQMLITPSPPAMEPRPNLPDETAARKPSKARRRGSGSE